MGLQHYGFAHRILPQFIAGDPETAFGLLASHESEAMLLRVWKVSGDRVEPREHSSPAGLNAFTATVTKDRYVAVVRLPAPTQSPEAFFVALAVWTGRRTSWLERLPVEHRYYTLELGTDNDGSPCTMFCEWRAGAHANLGAASSATEAAFLRAVTARLDSPHC